MISYLSCKHLNFSGTVHVDSLGVYSYASCTRWIQLLSLYTIAADLVLLLHCWCSVNIYDDVFPRIFSKETVAIYVADFQKSNGTSKILFIKIHSLTEEMQI